MDGLTRAPPGVNAARVRVTGDGSTLVVPVPRPAGALLFSCTGRGAGLFGRPDHDTGLFEDALGPAALGGFFCNGEIGPVGGRTFLHGYTSAFALFRPARRAPG